MIWVFGPGEGELVAVRAPPGRWLLVDGCTANARSYGRALLSHYGEPPSLILLSHPHRDHARGVAEVVEEATRGDPETWPRLGMVPAPDTRGAGDEWDAEAALHGGVAEHAIATMLLRWRRNPACRWDLDLGSSEHLGDARVRVLSPARAETEAALEAWLAGKRREYNYNRAATALLVTWGRRRILLGSDLVEEPGEGWSAAMAQDKNLRKHDLYKVAHHASENAFGPQLDRPKAAMLRNWVAAPFASKGLPDLSAGGSVDRLLSIESPLWLTALPKRHADQSGQLEDGPCSKWRASDEIEFTTRTSGFPDCFVCAVIPRRGAVRIERGAGSVVVREG